MTDSIRQQIMTAIDIRFKGILLASQVIGTDTKNYTCKLAHVAADDKKPITGADWATYWTQTGSSGIAWVTGTSYIVTIYKTNLGSHIFGWRDLENNPFQASELPGINLRDDIAETSVHSTAKMYHVMPIKMDIATISPEEMRKALADIEKAMHTDRTWGNLASHTDLLSDESVVEQKENKYFRTSIIMEVQYFTAIGDPYST